MNRKKIGILFGGSSSEYEISLKSAYGIISHIDRKRYEPVLLGITREGTWFLYQGDIERIKDGNWYRQPACIPAVISPDRRFQGVVFMQDGVIKQIRLDAALPVMHGRLGEDGRMRSGGAPLCARSTARPLSCSLCPGSATYFLVKTSPYSSRDRQYNSSCSSRLRNPLTQTISRFLSRRRPSCAAAAFSMDTDPPRDCSCSPPICRGSP